MSLKEPSAWCSLVKGDEQLDRPNSLTRMESFRACAALFILGLSQTQQLTAWADTAFISLAQVLKFLRPQGFQWHTLLSKIRLIMWSQKRYDK